MDNITVLIGKHSHPSSTWNQDAMLSGTNGVELEGQYPVYLDSLEEFVQEILMFLYSNGL